MLETGENRSRSFIALLTQCLSSERFKEALDLFEDDSHGDIIQEKSWDIVPLVSSRLSTENAANNAELLQCCEAILNVVVERCNPSETVLELLEQIDHGDNDLKFCVILGPLSKVMQKISDKETAIEWCGSTIRSYINGLNTSDKEEYENSDKDKIENSPLLASRVENVYNAILAFIEPLVQETVSNQSVIMKHHLVSLLIFLMGKPFCYLNESSKTSSFVASLAHKIVTLVSLMVTDLLKFLSIVRKRANQSAKKSKFHLSKENYNLEIVLFEFPENAPQLAYANFYFYIISVPALFQKVPMIYDRQYIVQSCLYLANSFLESIDVTMITKGLSFTEHLLQRIEKRCVNSDMLEVEIYIDIIASFVKIMVYCGSKKYRAWALEVFKKYFEIFDMEGRYFVISNLYKTAEHSGFLSLITCLLKASIIECLDSVPQLPYFLGTNLKSLLKLTCKLPHGGMSDLVELSDEIITNLNLLRFLFLRDRNNDTGIWNMVEELDKDYLEPLRVGLGLCKGHWAVKIKDLEAQKKLGKNEMPEESDGHDTEVTLIVGGDKLPPMTLEKKLIFCQQAFNGLDVMECLLVRINECIANNPEK